jgi:ATP-dependent exoDNAse (exonuclease V) beta subunit
MLRPFRAAASADSRAETHEEAAERQFAVPDASRPARAGDRDAEIARAAGTAVHRVLEALRLDGDVRAELAQQAERIPEELARAREVLARLSEGPLLARLRALRDHVVARELPVLLPAEPEGDGAVGFVAGAIDLLYRDPATNEFVVVDYKTDRVAGEAALAERAARYAGQAAHYRRAVQEALDLPQPPRFELWFLHAGAVLPLG